MLKTINDWKFLILAFLTLGLAPFFPEPHLFGKIRWVAGGAIGMKPLDWFDLFFHGIPLILIIRLGAIEIFRLVKRDGK